jgi:hypothetical protein
MTNPSYPTTSEVAKAAMEQGEQVIKPGPAVQPLTIELIRSQLEKRRVSLIQQLEIVEAAGQAMADDAIAEGVLSVIKAGTRL